MDLKEEPSDPYEAVVKTEPDVSEKAAENDLCFTKQEPFKNDNYLLEYGDTDNINCEYKANDYFVNVDEIKQETVECVVPKIEYQLSDLPEKVDCDSIKQFVSSIVKKELDVDISETKQEFSDSEYKQVKTETDLLNSYCDLPTLKSENTEYSDNFVQPCSSKYPENTLETLKTTKNAVSNKKKLYPCLVCQKNFPSKSRSKHTDGHFGKGFVVCEFCGKLMPKINFFRHNFIHVVKTRPAEVSLKINVSSTKQHLIIHSNEKPFKCDFCSKEYTQKYNLRQHIKTHTNQTSFKCDKCSTEFKHKCSLQKHLKEMHTDKKPFKCDLLAHLKIHTEDKPFKCEICCKEYRRKFSLQKHLIYHTNKSFKCDICSTKFKRKSSFLKHLKIIHSDKKPFKCDICPKNFKRKFDLQIHLTNHTNEKPFKCNKCSNQFKLKCNLLQHLKVTHTDNKPFKCDKCSKEFKRKSALRIHLIIHTNEKPFKCDICSKVFKLKCHLKQHQIIHTNEEPIKCSICSKGFKRKYELLKHLVIHTDKNLNS